MYWYMVCYSTIKCIVNVQNYFPMINDVYRIVIQLKNLGHYFLLHCYILHVYNTFYGAVTYQILTLYVNCLILNLQKITIFKMTFLHSAGASW